ncbi:MAG: hypothetical protein ACSHYA_03240 [Opitutaceae bacterium]
MVSQIYEVIVGVVLVPTMSLPNGANRDFETVLGTSKRLDHTRSSGFAKATP